jgi:hypothetical protein
MDRQSGFRGEPFLIKSDMEVESKVHYLFSSKDLLQRKYVQHVRGQITELFPKPI